MFLRQRLTRFALCVPLVGAVSLIASATSAPAHVYAQGRTTPECAAAARQELTGLRHPLAGLLAANPHADRVFDTFLRCEGAQYDLATAVHEGVHIYDLIQGPQAPAGTMRYLLLDGTVLAAQRFDSFDRAEAAQHIGASAAASRMSAVYLQGASGHQGVHILLDELNAYAHGLHIRRRQQRTRDGYRESARDGGVFMALALGGYLRAAGGHPETLALLEADDFRAIARALLSQVNAEVQAACAEPSLGIQDTEFARALVELALDRELNRLTQPQAIDYRAWTRCGGTSVSRGQREWLDRGTER
jgi:hypothetical protein